MLQLKIENLKFKIAVVIFLLSTTAYADLQWITDGLPQNTPSATTETIVKDAPADDTHPAAAGTQEIIVSHLITCTKMVNQYPVDSVNYFYLNKNTQICYFAYFLMKPSSRIHTATVECFSPANTRIAKFEQEFRVGFTDRLLTVGNDTYQFYLVDYTLGMSHINSQSGQTGLPRDPGLYTFHLTVDGQLAGITFFYVKDSDFKTPQPVATIPSAQNKASGNSMPLSTPVSSVPFPKRGQ